MMLSQLRHMKVSAVVLVMAGLLLGACVDGKSAQAPSVFPSNPEKRALTEEDFKLKDDSDAEAARIVEMTGRTWIDKDGIMREIPRDLKSADTSVQEAFKDRIITESEYQQGFRRWMACVEEKGLHVIEEGLVQGEPWQYSYATDEDTNSEDSCYKKLFLEIDAA